MNQLVRDRAVWVVPLALMMLGSLSACGPKVMTDSETTELHQTLAGRNAQAFEAARERALREHRLTLRATQEAGLALDLPDDAGPRVVRTVAAAPNHGLTASEQLVLIARDPELGPELALFVPSCANGQSCGCREPATHLIGVDPGGRELILRLREVIEARQVRQAGTCGYGCGQPSPARPPSIYLLKETGDTLRIVDVPYTHETITVICDKKVPLP